MSSNESDVCHECAESPNALLHASEAGHVQCTTALLQQGANVNAVARRGVTALISAASNGWVECVNVLLAHDATVDTATASGMTALMRASSHGHEQCMRALLARSADANLENARKWTPLFFAVKSGHGACTQLLIDSGACVSHVLPNGATCLMLACQKGHVACASALLDAGAVVDAQQSDGETALTLSCRFGRDECAQLLLEHGGSVDLALHVDVDDGACTPLMFACNRGSSACTCLLLENGASVNAVDHSGHSVLTHACLSNDSTNDEQKAACVRLLLDQGANVNAEAFIMGLTPLMAACLHGYCECTRILLESGAYVNTGDAGDDTALAYACDFFAAADEQSKLRCIQLLLAFGADRNRLPDTVHGAYGSIAHWLKDTRDWSTALHYFEYMPPERTVALLRMGCDINAAVRAGAVTPLQLAHSTSLPAGAQTQRAALLQAAAPWSPATHHLWPAQQRADALALMLLAHQVAATNFPREYSALIDAFREFVIPLGMTRDAAFFGESQ